ncbi:MAG: primosomal protein N' [Gammaproteobacteria bacterium]|nr:primosomal protein N' [Gammaproteobacteria bacterium]
MDVSMTHYLRLAIPTPLRSRFDYLAPAGVDVQTLLPGIRIKVPFGRRECVGILLAVVTETDVPATKLKTALEILDETPLLNKNLLDLMQFVAEYYHHPLGDVIVGTLPRALRQGQVLPEITELHYRLTKLGQDQDPALLTRAPKQAQLLKLLLSLPTGVSQAQLKQSGFSGTVINHLITKTWLEVFYPDPIKQSININRGLDLTIEQANAVKAINAAEGFKTFLLAGITGSGKTEVYLQAMSPVLAAGKQVLMLVPEIGLTPQTAERLQDRFQVPVALLHSGLSAGQRLQAWLQAYTGTASIILGTRSALFASIPNLGLIVVDEEHDHSFKQMSGLRYHARDCAVKRAGLENIPIILGSATPSLESLANVRRKRYHHLKLTSRVGRAELPKLSLINLRDQKLQAGLSSTLLEKIKTHLENEQQVLLFINRRGYAPVLMCHHCGWNAPCPRCDAKLTLHQAPYRLYCHHCETRQTPPRVCPQCKQSELMPVGQGTERLAEFLTNEFPDYPCVRIDGDSTRAKNSLANLMQSIHNNEARLLVGTQILAKGHHFPNLTLVAIVDVDGGLLSADFRAVEQMAQLIVQVGGRAGRADKSGEVVLQTHYPEHPLLTVLLKQGYDQFSETLLKQRQDFGLPPYAYQAVLRAEALKRELPNDFLVQVKASCSNAKDVSWLGPMTLLMERKAGRYRQQLILQSASRKALHIAIENLLAYLRKCPLAKKVRWNLDVDPLG